MRPRFSDRLTRYVGLIVGREAAESITARLAADSTATYILRVSAAAFSLIIAMTLARTLDVAGYGVYTYVIAWASSLHVIAACGLDRLLTRNVATYLAREQWSYLRGLLQWSATRALVISVIAAIAVGFGASWLLHGRDDGLRTAVWLGMFAVPVLTLNILRGAAMQGLHRVILGQVPDRLVQPILIVGFTAAAYYLGGRQLTPAWAVGLTAAAMLGSFLLGVLLLGRVLPAALKRAPAAAELPAWHASIYPLALVSWASIAADQADTLLLGTLGNVEDVGIYSVGIRGVRLISFSLIAVNTALAPAAARLFALGQIAKLHRVAVRSSRIVLLLAIPLAAGLFFFRRSYLGLFGPDFVQGEQVLLILILGQLFNAAAGSGSLLLIVAGHERDVAVATTASSIVQLGLCFLLIPAYGAIGAAFSRVATIASLNFVLAVLLYKRVGIHCFSFAPLPPSPSSPPS